MEKIKKESIKKIISEEITRYNKIKELEAKKAQLSEAIKLLEEEENLDEISWEGIKQGFGFGAKKAGEIKDKAVDSVVGAVDKKVTGINKAVDKFGKKVTDKISNFKASAADSLEKGANRAKDSLEKGANKAAEVRNKISTGYKNLDAGITQFSNDLSNAVTAGDIKSLEGKMGKMFSELQKMVAELNQKQTKLGMNPTTLKSILFKAANAKRQAMAEGKKK